MPDYLLTNADGEEMTFEVQTQPSGVYLITTPDGETLKVDAYAPEEGRLNMLIEAMMYDVDARRDERGHVSVDIDSHRASFEVLNPRQQRMRTAGVGSSGAAGPELVSPMAGKVIALNVAVGDQVTKGDPVIIVEAMKMENDLKAHVDGVVASIDVEPGQAVEVGDVLVTITPDA